MTLLRSKLMVPSALYTSLNDDEQIVSQHDNSSKKPAVGGVVLHEQRADLPKT
jgi:hypothetical protein